MKDDRIIATLNGLIEASKDAETGFAVAARDTHEPELIRVFSGGEKASRAAAAELQDQVRLLGGTAAEDGTLKAGARRTWTSVRAKVNARDDGTILEECERDESYVRERYAEALTLDLPEAIRFLVERHHGAIVDSHYRVLDLRNRFRDRGARDLRASD